MSQRLSELLRVKQGFSENEFYLVKPVRNKLMARSAASRKGWVSRKRMAKARAVMQALKASKP